MYSGPYTANHNHLTNYLDALSNNISSLLEIVVDYHSQLVDVHTYMKDNGLIN